jgi:O-antigen/teichoic acid export membrane protein
LSTLRENFSSIARNTSIMLIQQIITWVSTFVLMLFMPRYLGPVDYGRLFVATSITQIFGIFVAYGGNFLIVKNVSRARERTAQILVDAVGLRFILGILSLIGVIVLAEIMDYPWELKIILYVLSIPFIWAGGSIGLYASYQGHELMHYTSLGAIVERLFVCAIGVAALLMGAHVVTMAVIIVFGSFSNFVLLSSFARKIISYVPSIKWKHLWLELKGGISYFLFAVFSTLYYRIDSVMLSKMTPESVVGWYGVSYRLFETLNFLPYIYSVALYPILSRLWTSEEVEHHRTTQKSLGFMIIAGIPVSIGVILFAEKIIHMFYGPVMYEPSIIVLQVLSGGLLILYVNMILGITLLSSDKQQGMAIVSLSAIPVNVILNLVLIPFFQQHYENGGIGGAISTTVTEFYMTMVFIKLMPQGFMKGFSISLLFKIALAGVGMFGIFWITQVLGINWIVQIVCCSAAYIGAAIALKAFDKSDQTIMIEMAAMIKRKLVKSSA